MSELKSLEFSTPKTYYESIASYKENNEQELIIRVKGLNQVCLEEFIKNFQASFNVVTDEESQLPEEESVFSQREFEALSTQIQSDTEVTEAIPNSSLNIFIEILRMMELQKPQLISYRFSDKFERRIDNGETQLPIPPHDYVVGRKPTVTVNVTSGIVKVELFRNNEPKPVAGDTFSQNDDVPLTISDFPIKPNDQFFLRVTGLGNTESKYTINGTWTVV